MGRSSGEAPSRASPHLTQQPPPMLEPIEQQQQQPAPVATILQTRTVVQFQIKWPNSASPVWVNAEDFVARIGGTKDGGSSSANTSTQSPYAAESNLSLTSSVDQITPYSTELLAAPAVIKTPKRGTSPDGDGLASSTPEEYADDKSSSRKYKKKRVSYAESPEKSAKRGRRNKSDMPVGVELSAATAATAATTAVTATAGAEGEAPVHQLSDLEVVPPAKKRRGRRKKVVAVEAMGDVSAEVVDGDTAMAQPHQILQKIFNETMALQDTLLDAEAAKQANSFVTPRQNGGRRKKGNPRRTGGDPHYQLGAPHKFSFGLREIPLMTNNEGAPSPQSDVEQQIAGQRRSSRYPTRSGSQPSLSRENSTLDQSALEPAGDPKPSAAADTNSPVAPIPISQYEAIPVQSLPCTSAAAKNASLSSVRSVQDRPPTIPTKSVKTSKYALRVQGSQAITDESADHTLKQGALEDLTVARETATPVAVFVPESSKTATPLDVEVEEELQPTQKKQSMGAGTVITAITFTASESVSTLSKPPKSSKSNSRILASLASTSSFGAEPLESAATKRPKRQSVPIAPVVVEPESDDVSHEGEVFEVARILGTHKLKGRLWFLVRWKDYDDSYNTWEEQKHMRSAIDAINDFHEEFGKATVSKPLILSPEGAAWTAANPDSADASGLE
ncbi:hypothetical protein BV898_16250 [Hypsibius exemplaris]|uniref:Chromo domain-containing protein n=1 Tax=Hypsibius exemplaris TaxID=2072580 RepID=A0A9X6RL36_HYPEX|nr:hypothetical protein BV898_16250 [Hypsibius exemplaris]